MNEEKVSVGVRLTDEGIAFFGTEEVNEMLARGWRVAHVDPDDAIVEEVPAESDEDEEFALVGFTLRVALTRAD